MKDDLDSIKSDPRVLQIYKQYIPDLKKNGDKWVGRCPLPTHKDKSPSFTVFQDMRACCFGCSENLNIFQLVERMEGCDFKTALDKVKSVIGDWGRDRELVESTFRPVAEPKIYKTIALSAYAKLENSLEKSPQAVAWLRQERGIQIETAKRLHLGFIQSIGKLAGEAGADIADGGWIAFPCIEGDKVVSIKYRSIVRKKPGGFARQPGMSTALFNSETIDTFEPVYVTEGEFDACVLEQAGFRAVSVPSAGVKLTPAQKDQLMQASMVILAGDNDGGVGNAYMDRLWRELGSRTYLLAWPQGMKDANQTYLEYCGRDAQKFIQLMDELTRKAKSQPMPDVYGLQEVMRNGDTSLLAEHPDRFRFPWPSVDKMVNVLPGNILGIGATNTGMGKTTWVVQATMFNARKYQRTVLNYQAEMQPSEIATMVAAQILRKDRNFLTVEDKRQAADQIEGVQYYVGSNPTLSDINQVLDVIEAAVKRLSADIVVLDHFHHLTTGMQNETQVQSAAMTRIKALAEQYQVVFINVGQPRKATQQTRGRQIHVTDFKGSGAWGDASNAVIALHRDMNKSDDPSQLKGVYEDKTLVKVLKARSMGTGASACYLMSFGEFAAFEEISTQYEEQPSGA